MKSFVGRFPSGQREQTVNLPSQTSMVRIHPCPPISYAGMAELADALDSGSSERLVHAGSSPVSRTTPSQERRVFLLHCKRRGCLMTLRQPRSLMRNGEEEYRRRLIRRSVSAANTAAAPAVSQPDENPASLRQRRRRDGRRICFGSTSAHNDDRSAVYVFQFFVIQGLSNHVFSPPNDLLSYISLYDVAVKMAVPKYRKLRVPEPSKTRRNFCGYT